jgi:hypothetical protein
MLNNKAFPQLPKYDLDLEVYRAINKSKLYKVAAHAVMFPYAEAISWIIKKDDLERRYIIDAKGKPMGSFQALAIIACYHLLEGKKILDDKLVNNFPHSPRDILKD